MARGDDFWWRLRRWLTAPRAAALLLGVLGVLVGYGGYLYHHCDCQSWPNLVAGWEPEFEGFYTNISSSLVMITITVLTIDWLNERRAEQQLKEQFMREMGSTNNGIALQAVRHLQAYEWDKALQGVYLEKANLRGVYLGRANLQEASLGEANLREAILVQTNLQGAYLGRANLQEANLEEANLQRTDLVEANLQGTYMGRANLQNARALRNRQLATASGLRGATMPDGRHYNGRFNLSDDIKDAMKSNIDTQDLEAMAHYYGVSLEDYLAGQEWAHENLPRLRRETGLDPDTGEPVQPTKGTASQPEEQQSDAPIVPATNWREYTLRRLREKFLPFGRK